MEAGATAPERYNGEAHQRVEQIFRFLKEIAVQRYPVPRNLREQVQSFSLEALPAVDGVQRGTASDDFILKVERPPTTPPPSPPEPLRAWLQAGWDDPKKDAKVHEERSISAEGVATIQRFNELAERVSAFEHWNPRRKLWADAERPVREVLSLFGDLYSLHGRLQREGEVLEVMLGRGMLCVRSADIEHPLLLQRLELTFDPRKPEFTLAETDRPLELYTPLLRLVPGVEGAQLAGRQLELDEGELTILDASVPAYLKGFVQALFANGQYLEPGQSEPVGVPFVRDRQVVFLRRRGQVAAEAMDRVLDHLREIDTVATSLARIVGVFGQAPNPDPSSVSIDSGPGAAGEPEPDLLLSKPSNREQREIARQLERYGCVLVQGPPGTGKSHTIANLLGHFLAKGKSVLVTAHTNKALRVLHGHIVPELQPLCVSALEGDLVARADLERAISGIVSRLSGADPEARRERRRAAELTAERQGVLERLSAVRTGLRDARTDETREIVVAGAGVSPAEAAKRVKEGKGVDDWIPGPVSAGKPLPLSQEEIDWLYRSNELVSSAEESAAQHLGIQSAELPAPADFARMVVELRSLLAEDLTAAEGLWARPPGLGEEADLRALEERLHATIAPLCSASAWQLAVLDAGREEAPGPREAWEALVRQIETLHKLSLRLEPAIARHGPQLPPAEEPEELERSYRELESYVRRGGRLGAVTLLMHPAWKKLIAGSRVGRRQPSSEEHFRTLADVAHLAGLRSETRARWDRQMGRLGGPEARSFGREPEQALHAIGQEIETFLAWHKGPWAELKTSARLMGIDWEKALASAKPLNPSRPFLTQLLDMAQAVLAPAIQARIKQVWKQQALEALANMEERLSRAGTGSPHAGAVEGLREAVQSTDSTAYEEAFGRLVDLEGKLGVSAKRRELLGRLDEYAPAWAAAIRARQGEHGEARCPGDSKSGWLWSQYREELQRRHSKDLQSLERDQDQLEERLQRLTAQLVDQRAWAHRICSTRPEARQALIGWLDTVKRIGRGTGIRVPRFRREAMKLMQKAREAVPVWIMPLSRVMESFDPRKDDFDVVIIDEASQADASALFALYLGRSVVVVGDDEQVSPEAVGQQLLQVETLIAEHLKGIPNSHLYDGRMSVYDLAKASFGGVIRLNEHFRCVPDIIEFSNNLSYHGTIRPLRDASAVPHRPFTVAYRVERAESRAKTNRKEADVVASLVAAVVRQPEYERASLGVISMVGEEQARLIEQLLRDRVGPVTVEKHQILCGNAAQFQGDERDVVFLSMVDAAGPDQPLPMRQEDRFKKRFNVAASRARNQMWVVHSLDLAGNLRSGDLRRRLIEHAMDPAGLSSTKERATAKAQSDFERRVLRDLIDRGYRVHPQWPVGPFRIDVVVECEGRRIAIECDGERFHGPDRLDEDLEREAILRRLGWRFVRLRGSEYYGDSDASMARVVAALEENQILPSGVGEVEDRDGADGLRDRVIRAAEQIRSEWGSEDEQPTSAPSSDDEPAATEGPQDGQLPTPGRRRGTPVWPGAQERPPEPPEQVATRTSPRSVSPGETPGGGQTRSGTPAAGPMEPAPEAPARPPQPRVDPSSMLGRAEATVKRNGTMTPGQLRQLLAVEELEARRLLSQLEDLGRLRRHGVGQSAYYVYIGGISKNG